MPLAGWALTVSLQTKRKRHAIHLESMTAAHELTIITLESVKKPFMNHFSSLLKKVRIILVKEEIDSLINEMLSSPKPLVLAFLNAHAITIAQKNNDFYHHLMKSDILLRDGIGLAIAMKAFGCRPGINMNGTDFIPLLLSRVDKTVRIAVYGTQSPWLELAIKQVALQHDIVSMSDGFQPDQHYINLYVDSRPEVILLGMGMPKQERIALQIKQSAPDNKVLVINGGAILDFISSRVNRAPAWVRRCRMEWIFRLMQEPRRLLHRYTVGIATFFYYLIRCKFQK